MLNLLIVDDQKAVREGLKKAVDWERLGYSVAGDADSAKSALEIIGKSDINVLLTDIVMPGKNGLNLIAEATKLNPHIKAVILSGYNEFQYAREAIGLGAYYYLTKPVIFSELERIFTEIRVKCESEEKERKKIRFMEDIITKHAYNVAENPGGQAGDAVPEPFSGIENVKDGTSSLLIDNIKSYINGHYNEEITLNRLAEMFYVHHTHICRLFKEKTGENFVDYLTSVRIEKSKRLLADPTLKIYDIAGMVGYESPKYFSRTFKETVGITPVEFRNKAV